MSVLLKVILCKRNVMQMLDNREFDETLDRTEMGSDVISDSLIAAVS